MTSQRRCRVIRVNESQCEGRHGAEITKHIRLEEQLKIICMECDSLTFNQATRFLLSKSGFIVKSKVSKAHQHCSSWMYNT